VKLTGQAYIYFSQESIGFRSLRMQITFKLQNKLFKIKEDFALCNNYFDSNAKFRENCIQILSDSDYLKEAAKNGMIQKYKQVMKITDEDLELKEIERLIGVVNGKEGFTVDVEV
jgi:hypothetical protein